VSDGLDPGLVHAGCVVCGSTNERGLRLRYTAAGTGRVEAEIYCHGSLAGYAGRVHGGVIAAALDGAMTHCLFTLGRTAVTAELAIKYREPVATGRPATVRAWLERDLAPLYVLQAELVQEGVVKAAASAKFMEQQA
jgi:acyl-coenzyme A thioesterase PaaI-like protein